MSAPSWAVPGARCVCINSLHAGRHLAVDAVYTIHSVNHDDGDVFLRLIGVFDSGPRGGWLLSRFRPLVTKTIEDDIALFKHLLNTTPVNEDA